MKKLMFLFMTLSVALFTSCSKDEEVKPDAKSSIVGQWKSHQIVEPDGKVVDYEGVTYIEFLQNNQFNEVNLESDGNGGFDFDSFEDGIYALEGNKLVTTQDIMWNSFDYSEVKFIDNDTLELTFESYGEVLKVILKRTVFDIKSLIPVP